MFLYLAHHGEAVSSDEDPQRPLSEAGVKGVRRLAREAAARQVKPAAIWHSGKLRARQTAEAFWRECNALSDSLAVRGLQSSDPPSWIDRRVGDLTEDTLLVGHLPNIEALLKLLAGDATVDFPTHGMVDRKSVV